jgi:hypothetical protein
METLTTQAQPLLPFRQEMLATGSSRGGSAAVDGWSKVEGRDGEEHAEGSGDRSI